MRALKDVREEPIDKLQKAAKVSPKSKRDLFRDLYKKAVDNNKWVNVDADKNVEVTNYCIFDDDSDMLESQNNNFIHVSNISGLRTKHYCKALILFGVPDERLEAQVNFIRKLKKGL